MPPHAEAEAASWAPAPVSESDRTTASLCSLPALSGTLLPKAPSLPEPRAGLRRPQRASQRQKKPLEACLIAASDPRHGRRRRQARGSHVRLRLGRLRCVPVMRTAAAARRAADNSLCGSCGALHRRLPAASRARLHTPPAHLRRSLVSPARQAVVGHAGPPAGPVLRDVPLHLPGPRCAASSCLHWLGGACVPRRPRAVRWRQRRACSRSLMPRSLMPRRPRLPPLPPAGMIASNGVNGTAGTAEHPASGIQGDFRLSLFQARAERKGPCCAVSVRLPPALSRMPLHPLPDTHCRPLSKSAKAWPPCPPCPLCPHPSCNAPRLRRTACCRRPSWWGCSPPPRCLLRLPSTTTPSA